MSTHPKILVTSGAGKTGLPVALQLLKKGVPVRAFVRRNDHRAETLARAGADVFVGNQYDVSDLREAMQGVQRAYQCAPTAPNGLHFNAAFTAAAEAKLDHVVTLGQWLTSADHPSLFTREVYLSDALARLSPDTTVTSVDPGWFADNYLMVLDAAAHLGLFTMPLGPGDEKKNAPPAKKTSLRSLLAHFSILNPTQANATAQRARRFCPRTRLPPPWGGHWAARSRIWIFQRKC